MNRALIKKFALAALLSSVAAIAANAQIIATDNFENNNPSTDYNNGIQYGDNGGVGFGPLTYLTGTGGGIFAANDGSNPPIDDAQSLGIFSGNGGGNTQALGRTTTSTFVRGMYSIDARFSLDNSVGFSGFNIKSGLGSAFGDNELLSFGLSPGSGNNQFLITDATGTHTLALPTVTELRGVNFNFAVSFDTLADTYTLKITDLANSVMNSFSGLLEDTNGVAAGTGALSAVGFANFNTGNLQNLIADNLSVVPEPSTWAAGALVSVGLAVFGSRRRRTA